MIKSESVLDKPNTIRRTLLRNLLTAGVGVGVIDAIKQPAEGAVKVQVDASWWGCVPDTGADMLAPLLAALNGINGITYAAELNFQPGLYLVSDEVTVPTALGNCILSCRGLAQFRYTGAAAPTKAVWRISATTSSTVSGIRFRNLQFNGNFNTGFAFVIEGSGGGTPQANFNEWDHCTFQNATVAGFLGGDTTGVQDISINMCEWNQCEFANGGTRNLQLDSANCNNNTFLNCSFTFNAGTSPINHILLARAAATHFYGSNFSPLSNADANTCCVRVFDAAASGAGGLSFRDTYSEELRFLRNESNSRAQRTVIIDNFYGNSGLTTMSHRYFVYAPVGNLAIRNCHAGGGAANPARDIYIGDSAIIENVDLGAGGRITLDFPARCVIQGIALGTFQSVNPNWDFSWWQAVNGAGVDDVVYDYSKITPVGPAVYNIKQITSIGWGQFSARVDVTTIGGGARAGFRFQLPRKYGPATVVAVGVAQFSDAAFSFLIGGVNYGTDYYVDPVTLEFFAWSSFDASALAPGEVTLECGVNDNSHGTPFYVNFASIIVIDKAFQNGLPTAITLAAQPNMQKNFHGALPPAAGAGTHYQEGTIIWNDGTIAAGQPIGWICSVAGEPGTWIAMPNL